MTTTQLVTTAGDTRHTALRNAFCWSYLRAAAVLIAAAMCCAQQSAVQPAQASEPSRGSVHFKLVREFSSDKDVSRDHPLLDRTLDIVAGKGEAAQRRDVLQMPYAVAVDAKGRVLVTDIAGKDVHVFDFPARKYSVFGGSEHLDMPAAIAVDGRGNAYISDTRLGLIAVFDDKRKFRGYFGKVRGENYFQSPRGIALAGNRLFLCDTPVHMIYVLDFNGRILEHWGKRGGGAAPGEFRRPVAVAVSGDTLAVLDSGNGRIQILDLHGHLRREIPLAGATGANAIAMDANKNIYVSDSVAGEVKVLSAGGTVLTELTSAIAGDGFTPVGLWIDAHQSLYVADSRNHRVQEYEVIEPAKH